MGPHLHVSFLDFAVVWAYVIIGKFLFNALAARFHDTTLGQALSVVAA